VSFSGFSGRSAGCELASAGGVTVEAEVFAAVLLVLAVLCVTLLQAKSAVQSSTSIMAEIILFILNSP
jgi:hypothetical protein